MEKQFKEFWQNQVLNTAQTQKDIIAFINNKIVSGSEKSISQTLEQINAFLEQGVKQGFLKNENSTKIYQLYEQNFNVVQNLMKNSQQVFLKSMENLSNPGSLNFENLSKQFNEYFLNNTKILSDLYNQQVVVAKDIYNEVKNNVEEKIINKKSKK